MVDGGTIFQTLHSTPQSVALGSEDEFSGPISFPSMRMAYLCRSLPVRHVLFKLWNGVEDRCPYAWSDIFLGGGKEE